MSNRIIIHKAAAEDFQLEVFSSAPVDGSSGDYEDGRIIKYLTHFYSWHDASGSWKKFIMDTDFSSLTTRLSTQEVGQAAAESSLATIDASLQTRISTEESASTSAVDSAQVRAEAAEGVISGNLSSELVNRAADVSAEASRASSAEVVLSTNLSSELVAREADVSAEKSRAEAAEGSLQTRLAAEESNELSAETSLNLRASTEESTRLAADNSVAVTISAEASTARSAETSLESRLSSEEDRVDAILNAASADKNTFVETVSFINAIDVAHDAQTSTQISSVDSAIASAESSRIASDSSLQTRLSSEESTEASAEVSLNTRMTAEASNELSAEGSLDVRSSSEEPLRLAEDTSIETTLDSAGSSRASGDSSLTTAASVEASTARSAEVSVQSSTSAAALARGNADTSLQTRLSTEESAMIVAVDSIEALRSAGDLSLTTRVSSEEVARAAGDSSLTTRTGVAESARSTADTSLTTRLAAEESNELSAETSLDTRVSSEASAQVLADASLQTRFSGELSTERSKLDAILDSAAADKDTFVEIVSFITSVDTESDDALASYVVSVDATISTEVSTARSSEAVLSTNLSSEVSAMGSAVTATYATISGNIATHAAAIDTKEQHEGVGRHMRIDFTSETSFSVAAVDLPTNFEPGNGMVQVFQLVSAGVYRHLVAPSTYNATTGVMSFDLGSTAKSGFVVFYSFAGDETEATEVPTHANARITGVDLSNLNLTASTATSIKLNLSGVTAANHEKHMSFENKFVFRFLDASALLMPMASTMGISESSYYPYVTATWAADYSSITYSWTNHASSPTLGENLSTGYSRIDMLIGAYGYSVNSYLYDIFLQLHVDSTDITSLKTTSGFGLSLADNSNSLPVYDYYPETDGIKSHSQTSTGPAWYWGLPDDHVSEAGYINGKTAYLASQWKSPLMALFERGGVQFTKSGATKYWAPSNTFIDSSHHLYSELTSNSASLQSGSFAFYGLATGTIATADKGLAILRTSGSAFPQPDANTDITFYGAIHEDNGTQSLGARNGIPEDAQTDIKMVISMSDRTASNMSVKFYRNSATSAAGVTWVEVDRLYLGGHDVS